MRRFPPLLLQLALLALVLGRSSGTASIATEVALQPGVPAGPEHALPAAPQVRLAPVLLSRGDRAGTGVGNMHAAPTGVPERAIHGPRTAAVPEPSPPAPCGAAGARAYFPTGPPLLV